MGASQSTSSSTTTNHDSGRKHDVFISFRGEDTGDNFTSHLYDALCRQNIHTFKDHRLGLGAEISPALLDAIEDSRISIVIFSKQFASSKRCLRELVEIMKCKKTKKQFVIPVFYHVEPSDVRKQTGSFKDAFRKHRKESQEELQEWRDALTEASNLSGWHSYVIRPESRLVDEIVKDVLNKLKDVSPSNDYRSLVGISSRIEKIKSLLSIEILDFRIVGIWGMGGIGKTTIAGAVFEEISCQFEGCCFVTNVREESEKYGGLIRLRDEILSTILEEEVNFGTPNIPLHIKQRLQSKKIIIVLDDVNSLKQVAILARGLDRFGPGSKIIVTSRDKQLLFNSRVAEDNIYGVEALDNCEALKLFCKYAFKEDLLSTDLMVFTHMVVDYANGNPLALKVLGSSLYRKSRQDWENALHKLNKISNPEIHNVLRIGYDGLDDEEKDIFLDIACLFKRGPRHHIIQILSGYYFSAQAGLSVLNNKSLITISGNDIGMHELLQEMGEEIVRQESIDKPGECSRLHNQKDVCLVLKKNIGTEAVKGIFLNMSKMKNIDMNSEAFEKMCNVRFLKFYNRNLNIEDSINISKVQLPSGLGYLPDRLSYFHWTGFPLKVLPSNLNMKNLVYLDLYNSNIDQLWEGKKHAPMLKWFVVENSKHLTRIPDLSGSQYLEVIDLIHCKSLVEISSSIQHLRNIRLLLLQGCESLISFPRDMHFESPADLNFSLCTNFTTFPQISGNIVALRLSGTAIEEVPSSVKCLTELILLNLSYCARLKNISPSICKLKSLATLDLSYCYLTEIPQDIGCLSALEYLDLCGNNFKSLPKSIKQLSNLRELLLKDCSMLQSLTDLPLGLECIEAENCKQLQSLADASYFADGVTICPSNGGPFLRVNLVNCLKLNLNVFGNILAETQQLIIERHRTTIWQRQNDIFEIAEKEYQGEEYKNDITLSFFCPGSEIPKWFSYQNSKSFIEIQLPQHSWSNRKLLGLYFCAVIPFEEHYSYGTGCQVSYDCLFKTNNGDSILRSGTLFVDRRNRTTHNDEIMIGSDHIFVQYRPYSRFQLDRHDYTTCSVQFRPSASVPFWPSASNSNFEVKSCGVSLIYAEANITEPNFSVNKFGTTSGSGRRMVEEYTETKEFLDEADTRRNASGISDDEEMDSHPKRFHEFKSLFCNNKVVIFYHTMRDRANLLCCYCWIFLLCVFCGLCVFGMLGLLLLHLSTLCEIYLSSHTQIMQGK